MPQLLAVDGNSVLLRAYYGVPPLTTSQGVTTHAVKGFFATLERVCKATKPDGLVVTFDLPAKTFRHKLYAGYKAARKPMPEDLVVQLGFLRRLLGALGVPVLDKEGYEADDILGTLARICSESGWHTTILTGDRDSYQLVSSTCRVTHAKGRDVDFVTEDTIRAKYGLPPRAMIDLKALMGDASDQIPGVPGVGEKTALALLGDCDSLDEIYAKIDEIPEKYRKKLIPGKESAYLSRELGTICVRVPLDFDPARSTGGTADRTAFDSLCAELEFGERTRRIMQNVQCTKESAPCNHPSHGSRTQALLATMPPSGGTAPAGASPARGAIDSHPLHEIGAAAQAHVYHPSHGRRAGTCGVIEGGEATLHTPFPCRPAQAHVGRNIKQIWRAEAEAGKPRSVFTDDLALMAWMLGSPETDFDVATMQAEMESQGMWTLYRDIELPLAEVLLEMELRGVGIDLAALELYGKLLAKELESLTAEVHGLAGRDFNILSPKQLGVVLFEELHLPHGKKNKSGGYATDAETLGAMKGFHPIVPAVLAVRTLSKLKSTYVDGLTRAAKDGVIHSVFQMTATATGRISSTEPNLQNIPIRNPLGAKLRDLFMPTVPGWVFCDADYSQVELRILASITDGAMNAAFRGGEDIHTATAAKMYDTLPIAVTSAMRRSAKAVNFGIVYGISAHSLGIDLGISHAEAKAFMARYDAEFPEVKQYTEAVVAEAQERGYVTTLFGRRRRLPELASPHAAVRKFGARAAVNTIIQGTAADIIKAAMVAVGRRLREEGLQGRLCLQVHDELIVECPPEETEAVSRILREEMVAAAPMVTPPLAVDVQFGANWGACKK